MSNQAQYSIQSTAGAIPVRNEKGKQYLLNEYVGHFH